MPCPRCFEKIANQIDALSEEMEALSDEELKAKTAEFKEQLENGADLEDLVVPAFAVVREAAYRVIGEKPYFVQILGGLAIHYGNIAEMKTGEGLTSTLIDLPAATATVVSPSITRLFTSESSRYTGRSASAV